MNWAEILKELGPIIAAVGAGLGGAFTLTFWYIRKMATEQFERSKALEAKNLTLTARVGELSTDVSTRKERERQLKEDILELRTQVTELKREFDDLLEKRNGEQETACQRALQYQDEIIKRDKENAALRDEIRSLKSQLADANKRLDDMGKQIGSLKGDYEAVVSERDSLREKTARMAEQIAQLQRENAAVTRHNGELDGKLRKLQEDFDMMKAQQNPPTLPPAPSPELIKAKRATGEIEVPRIEPGPYKPAKPAPPPEDSVTDDKPDDAA